MKFVLFILIAICISSHGLELNEELTEYANNAIAKLIATAFTDRLEENVIRGFHNPDLEPKVTGSIIGPGEEPTYLETIELPLNINLTIGEGFKFESTGHFRYESPEVSGLSMLTDKFDANLVARPLTIKWDFNLPTVYIKGKYDLDQTVESDNLFTAPGQHTFNGTGDFLAGVDDVFVTLEARVKAAGLLEITELVLDLGFKNLTGHAENTFFDGVAADLDNIIKILETAFGLIWTGGNKVKITESVRVLVNDFIKECTLAGLIGGNLECLSLPETTGSPFTTTTPDSTTPTDPSPPSVITTTIITTSIIVTDSTLLPSTTTVTTTTTYSTTTESKPDPTTQTNPTEDTTAPTITPCFESSTPLVSITPLISSTPTFPFSPSVSTTRSTRTTTTTPSTRTTTTTPSTRTTTTTPSTRTTPSIPSTFSVSSTSTIPPKTNDGSCSFVAYRSSTLFLMCISTMIFGLNSMV